MAFNIGNPFSPEMLGLIVQERSRRDRAKEAGQDDRFRYAQLNAGLDESSRERAIRVQMANAEYQMQNARTQAEREAADRQFAELQRQFDVEQAMQRDRMAEETRRFDIGVEEGRTQRGLNEFWKERGAAQTDRAQTEAERHNKEAEHAARLREENRGLYYDIQADRLQLDKEKLRLDREKEFGAGSVDAPGKGSRAAGRAARAGADTARAEEYRKRAELATARLEGRLPEQIQGERRVRVLERAQDLAEKAQAVRTAAQASRLAVDLLDHFKDEYTGGYNVPTRQTMSQMKTMIQALLGDAELVRAFTNKFLSEGSGRSFEGAQVGRPGLGEGAAPPDPRARGGLQQSASAIEAARERARNSAGQPPGTVGR